MTDKLHCPFCSEELTIQPRKVANFEIAVCRNPVCEYAGWHLPVDIFVCLKDGIMIDKFHGTREASRQTGIGQARISDCCRGITKHAGGFQWKYIDGDWENSLMECGK